MLGYDMKVVFEVALFGYKIIKVVKVLLVLYMKGVREDMWFFKNRENT